MVISISSNELFWVSLACFSMLKVGWGETLCADKVQVVRKRNV